MDDIEARAQYLSAKIDELKAMHREANEMLRDLRSAIKEGRALRDELKTAAEVAVNEQMVPVVKEGLEQFGRELSTAIDLGTEAVFRRFDTVADTLLGEDKASKRQGKISLPDLAAEVKGRRENG